MQLYRLHIQVAVLALTLLLTGCASTYGNLASGSKLGANEYQPAVHVPDGVQAKYNKVLKVCRKVAENRQVTSAQRAQLETITGVTEGAASGAAAGLRIGSLLEQSGFDDADLGETAAVSAAAGALSSLGQAFASGTEGTASETRRILLNCLRSQEDAVGYTVLE